MKSVAAIVFCLLVLLTVEFKAHALIQDPVLKSSNDSASYFLDRGDDERAAIILERALNKASATNEEISQSHLQMATAREAMGFNKDALHHFRLTYTTATDKGLKCVSATGIANSLTSDGKYDSVEFFINESIHLDSATENLIKNESALGRFWQIQNIVEKSIHHWQRAIDLSRAIQNQKLLAISLAGMASASFSHDPGMQRVLKYLRESISLCDSTKDAALLARNCARVANAYMVLEKGPEAEQYLIRAKKISDLTKNLPAKSYVLSSYAIFKAEQGDVEGALEYSMEPLKVKRMLGQMKPLENDLLNVSEWYTVLGQYVKARAAMKEGIETSKKIGDVVYLQYFYDRLAKLDSITGNHVGAYSNLRTANFYKDSAESLKRFRAVEEVREKYEAEQKEKLLAEKEVEIERQKLVQVSTAAMASIVILLLVVLIIVFRSRHRKKLQAEYKQQSRLQLETIVQTQEEVQQSIARDLHDGLVQIIGAAKMSLESVGPQTEKSLALNRIADASRIIDEAVTEARNISHQMLPYSLLRGGLEAAIDELLAKSFPNYTFRKADASHQLSEDVTINVYRIVQELVNNVIKHSDADHVTLIMTMSTTTMALKFEDNGKGFDKTWIKNGVGLTNIRTRCELIYGTLELDSSIGKGTSFKLTVPL
jgi:two-component system NarL family sensor kinase